MRARSFIAAVVLTAGCAAHNPPRPKLVDPPRPNIVEPPRPPDTARVSSDGAESGTAKNSVDSASNGFLGATWGEDGSARATQWGLRCASWSPWEGNDPKRGVDYDACFETEHPVWVYGLPTYARLFRKQGRLEGVSVRFTHSGALRASLVASIRRGFGMDPGADFPYELYIDSSLVRFTCDDGDDSCELTVAGPSFGAVLLPYIVGQGMSVLASGLMPR